MQVNPAVLALLMFSGRSDVIEQIRTIKKDPETGSRGKLCLRCKLPHTHHNSFCSAECCRRFKAEKRGKAT
jgi:hypothetical protein